MQSPEVIIKGFSLERERQEFTAEIWLESVGPSNYRFQISAHLTPDEDQELAALCNKVAERIRKDFKMQFNRE